MMEVSKFFLLISCCTSSLLYWLSLLFFFICNMWNLCAKVWWCYISHVYMLCYVYIWANASKDEIHRWCCNKSRVFIYTRKSCVEKVSLCIKQVMHVFVRTCYNFFFLKLATKKMSEQFLGIKVMASIVDVYISPVSTLTITRLFGTLDTFWAFFCIIILPFRNILVIISC